MRPTLAVVAGPNGSGKTTLTRELVRASKGFHVNPDDLATEKAAAEGNTFEDQVAWAAEESRRLRDEHVQNKKSVSYETVMSHSSHLDVMRAAQSQNMDVRLIYVFTQSPDINVARVRERVASGGHDVPETKIRSRYLGSLGQLMEACSIATHTLVFDNSGAPDEAYIAGIGSSERLLLSDRLRRTLSTYSPSKLPANAGYFQGKTHEQWTEFSLDSSNLALEPNLIGYRFNELSERFKD